MEIYVVPRKLACDLFNMQIFLWMILPMTEKMGRTGKSQAFLTSLQIHCKCKNAKCGSHKCESSFQFVLMCVFYFLL